jgi:hypothetical protein
LLKGRSQEIISDRFTPAPGFMLASSSSTAPDAFA